ncbi:MAG: protein-L-isoaspartate(D-aspartate) O-methyltransferase [Bacteroidales bacterium]|nr:protein-L-isoaspartate(D-aspartate) O-methyltransferase [Bacteroidales bacterium]
MRTVFSIVFFLSCCLLMVYSQTEHDYFEERKEERRNMVYRDVANYRGIDIYDTAVLGAMFRVPRHAFVINEMQPYAYQNTPLPIGFEQTISQPVIVASMTQLLEAEKEMKILEIGTGSGYQAAILAELGCEVFTIEIVPELGLRAKNTLEKLHYENVRVKVGDGYEGWPEYAPFDRIIVTCAPEQVPAPLKEQLKPGGKIVIPVGSTRSIQFLVVLEKNRKGKLRENIKYPVRFVPMTGKAREK